MLVICSDSSLLNASTNIVVYLYVPSLLKGGRKSNIITAAASIMPNSTRTTPNAVYASEPVTRDSMNTGTPIIRSRAHKKVHTAIFT